MNVDIYHRELPSLSAEELLKRWAGIHGPDPRTECRNRRRGTLGARIAPMGVRTTWSA
jgi:hypothetical protein